MENCPRAMGDTLCFGCVNWPCAFNSVGLSRIDCGPAVLPPSCLWPWAARRVCLFCARSSSIGLIPAVDVAYFANDAVVIALLAMGSAIAAAFVCMLLRGKRDNNSDIACASDTFDARVFSPALSPREEQFVRLLLKGKTPAEIAKETDTKPSTVRTTLHRAYGKASVAGSRELVALFAGEGDTVGHELPQRHADDMVASARTRRLFRYLLTLFFILLAAGPLVMADSDWGSGVSWAVTFSLSSYALGLGLLLSLRYAGGKPNRGAALDRAGEAIWLGSRTYGRCYLLWNGLLSILRHGGAYAIR